MDADLEEIKIVESGKPSDSTPSTITAESTSSRLIAARSRLDDLEKEDANVVVQDAVPVKADL